MTSLSLPDERINVLIHDASMPSRSRFSLIALKGVDPVL